MCGLVGIINKKNKVLSKDLKIINKLQIHRGPDDEGYFIEKNIGMAMRRLSIVGINEGSQPKISSDRDKIIFFNGEIFNFQKLSNTLLKKNLSSEIDVLLQLYQKYGLKFIKKLNGMFVIVIYDKKLNKIFFIRDRFGIKPLYYYLEKNQFAYSSEILPIKKYLKIDKIDMQSASNYFTLGYVYNDDQTIYEKIKKIKPGSILTLDLSNFIISSKIWWKPDLSENKKINKKNYLKIVEKKLINAVESWSKSDVPISFLLSGGLDSGLLAAIYSSRFKKKLNTFSMSFDDSQFKAWDETDTINDFLKKYNCNHQSIKFNLDNIKKDIFKIVKSAEEPYGGGIPSWFLLKQIKKKFKVTISGIGGDELFGNYNRFLRYKSLTRNYYNKKNFNNFYFFNKFYKLNDQFKKKFFNFNFKKIKKTEEVFFKIINERKSRFTPSINFSYLDLTTQLVNEFLFFSDKFSMRHSIELRTPFLDNKLFKAAYSIPENLRLNYFEYKPILRKIALKYLPKKYLKQDKKGFSIPLSILMRKNMKNITKFYLAKKKIIEAGFVKPVFINEVLNPFFKGSNSNILIVWNVLMFHIWFYEFHKKN